MNIGKSFACSRLRAPEKRRYDVCRAVEVQCSVVVFRAEFRGHGREAVGSELFLLLFDVDGTVHDDVGFVEEEVFEVGGEVGFEEGVGEGVLG